ncbi:hypothetical protein P7C73_g6577, partial [Tremellales sp. Uapishka_1]
MRLVQGEPERMDKSSPFSLVPSRESKVSKARGCLPEAPNMNDFATSELPLAVPLFLGCWCHRWLKLSGLLLFQEHRLKHTWTVDTSTMRSFVSAFVSALLLSAYTKAEQLPFIDEHEPESTYPALVLTDDRTLADLSLISLTASFAETVVSALSSSSQHTIFLHLLQRSKSIPMLAHMSAATVFAPTDRAWENWAEKHRPGEGEDDVFAHGWLGKDGLEATDFTDNQNWALRQHLLYHMLNYTLSPSRFGSNHSKVSTETTLLFPLLQEPKLPPTPPPGPPWLPRGGEELLGGRGQRLRVGKERIGADWKGDGGARIWDGSGWDKGNGTRKQIQGGKWTRNGAVIGIEDVLEPPPDIESIIKSHPSLTYLSTLLWSAEELPSPLPKSLNSTPHLTVFAPSNEAFGSLDEVERRYLESDSGEEGVGRVVSSGIVLAVGKDGVGWSDSWEKKDGGECLVLKVVPKLMEGMVAEAVNGEELVVESSDGSLRVNGTTADEVDIFASNEKVLLSYNATRFVALLRSANLSNTYVGGTDDDKPWTILAPTDDVLDTVSKWDGTGAPLTPNFWMDDEPGYFEDEDLDSEEALVIRRPSTPVPDVSPLAALLQYHILPFKLSPDAIKDGMLLPTELRPKTLSGQPQMIKVEVSERYNPAVEWIDAGEIKFGATTVLASPVNAGQSIIYLISNLLSPPLDVLQTAISDLRSSTFIAAVYSADLEKLVKKSPGVTWLIPRNKAFGDLGLVLKYLLLSDRASKDDLRKVLKYHALEDVVYEEDFRSGDTTYRTLEGSDIVLERIKGTKGYGNGSLALRSPRNKFDMPLNGELRSTRLLEKNALTETGVIHTVDQVMLPSDVDITLEKLVKGSKESTMLGLMKKAGLSWVLEGRDPVGEEVVLYSSDATTPMPSFTILCPTDKAFARLNISALSDEDLESLLKLHIIPADMNANLDLTQSQSRPRDGEPLFLNDDLVYSTLYSNSSKYGKIAFRATGDNSYIVGIKDARGGGGNEVARVGASG